MELGLNATPQPADEHWWQDLGVTWYKMSADVDQEGLRDDRAVYEYAATLGLRPCVDLRVSMDWVHRVQIAAYEQLLKEGKMLSVPEEAIPPAPERKDFADQQDFENEKALWEQRRLQIESPVIMQNQKSTHTIILEQMRENIQAYVDLHRDYCTDWEWWGEWACPVTSKGIFHLICYPDTLKVAYEAIHEVQPEARVWTGGNGMDLNDGWIVGLRQDGALKHFDVLNWHPYPMAMRDREQIEEKLRRNYSEWAPILQAEGRGQPLASTEWGYPSLMPMTQEQRQWLESNVIQGGITQMYAEEAVAAYEGDLQIMEEAGFEVVMVHTLRDGKTRFWGEKCGLLTIEDEEKPTYAIAREWAHKGRAGRPAFTARPQVQTLAEVIGE